MPCISFNLNEFSAVVCAVEFTVSFHPKRNPGRNKNINGPPRCRTCGRFFTLLCARRHLLFYCFAPFEFAKEKKKRKREWNRTWNCRTQGANVSAKKFLFILGADDFFSFFECVYGGSWCKRGDDLLFGTSNRLLFVIFCFLFVGIVGKLFVCSIFNYFYLV